MDRIISELTFIPMRAAPSHKSEQVSQILYGERAVVLDKTSEWVNIRTDFDNYEGWVEEKVIRPVSSQTKQVRIVRGFERLVRSNENSIWFSTGSEIHSDMERDQEEFHVQLNPDLNHDNIIELAKQFLGTPYLWGGRSFMGIDCSGLTQATYKALGINLPRDASEQVLIGKTIPFISQSLSGDLAFFDNAEGEIVHVGILLDSTKIIHSSGYVKIEQVDQQGIYDSERKRYTHKLRLIKRLA